MVRAVSSPGGLGQRSASSCSKRVCHCTAQGLNDLATATLEGGPGCFYWPPGVRARSRFSVGALGAGSIHANAMRLGEGRCRFTREWWWKQRQAGELHFSYGCRTVSSDTAALVHAFLLWCSPMGVSA